MPSKRRVTALPRLAFVGATGRERNQRPSYPDYNGKREVNAGVVALRRYYVIVQAAVQQERRPMQLQTEFQSIEASVQSKLARIGSELAITDAQERAWASFVGTIDEIAKTLEVIGDKIAKQYSDRAPLVSETLDVQVDVLATRLKFAQILRGKVRELLQALMPEQRRRADRLLLRICDELCIPNRMVN